MRFHCIHIHKVVGSYSTVCQALTCVKALTFQSIAHFGVPTELIYDKATQFTSQ